MSKGFSQSVEQLFLTVGQNNFGNKIPRFNQNVIANFTRVCLLVTKVLTLPFPAVNTAGSTVK